MSQRLRRWIVGNDVYHKFQGRNILLPMSEVEKLVARADLAAERERGLVEALAACFSRLPEFQKADILSYLRGEERQLDALPIYVESITQALKARDGQGGGGCQ